MKILNKDNFEKDLIILTEANRKISMTSEH